MEFRVGGVRVRKSLKSLVTLKCRTFFLPAKRISHCGWDWRAAQDLPNRQAEKIAGLLIIVDDNSYLTGSALVLSTGHRPPTCWPGRLDPALHNTDVMQNSEYI
jgi:hypothetical protein